MMLLDAGIGASRGDAVLALLERAQVPPVPPFYKLCYDYLAGVRSLDTIRAGSMLEAPPEGRAVGEMLYEDFVAPYRQEGSIIKVVSSMLDRIQVIEKLVIESQQANRTQAADLAGATADLGGEDIDPVLLRDWVARLKATNDALGRANAALSEELDRSMAEVTSAQDEMAALSRTSALDPLTGIANRSGVDDALNQVLAQVQTANRRLSLAIVDIDHFKHLNDTYGHLVGDEILRMVARALTTATRDIDIVGRMGGDEFIVVVRDEDLTGARAIAERVRRNVIDCDLAKLLGKDVLGNVTVSIGLAQHVKGESVATLYERADRCLFEAKNHGRNQVVAETPVQRDTAA